MAVDYQVLHYFPVWCASVGVKHAVICSGSRSAPLSISFSGYTPITCHYAIDERSAGYMALGMSQATDSPVVIIVTSGTAVPNLYPAVAEAYFSHTPLIVLSADRPPEAARHYEGQSMFQQELFGTHVLHFVQCCQTTNPSALDWLRNQFQEAITKALGRRKGPIHFNFPFEEPFYPTKSLTYPQTAAFENKWEQPSPADSKMPNLQGSEKAILVIGRMGASADILNWAQKYQVPVFADITCGLEIPSEIHISSFEMLLRNGGTSLPEPDLVLSSGRGLVSKILKKYIQRLSSTKHIYIASGGETHEPTETASVIISGDPNTWKEMVMQPNPEFLRTWKAASLSAETQLNHFIRVAPFSEISAMAAVMRAIPESFKVHTGNSMPIRWAQMFMNGRVVHCNRGVSGIDGAASSFMGSALVCAAPAVLITGDVSFFYDLNAFWQERLPEQIKVIVLNNRGGGIFRLIDGPRDLPERETVFVMPRQRDIQLTVNSFGMDYCSASDEVQLAEVLPKFFNHRGAAVLEIVTDPEINGEVFELYRKISLK